MHVSGRSAGWFLIVFIMVILYSTDIRSQQLIPEDSVRLLLNKTEHDTTDLIRLNQLIKDIWASSNGTDEFVDVAHNVLEAARKSNNRIIEADALMNLVKIYLTKFESSQSLEYALDAYKIYEQAGLKDKMAYTLLQLGVIYYTQNNFTKSLEYYNSAVNQYEKTGNKQYIATLFYLSGINYSKLDNFPSALLFFRRALSLKQELHDEQGLAECYLGLAELFIKQSQPDSAEHYINSALKYTKATNNDYGTAKSYILLAESMQLRGKYNDAHNIALQGKYLADSIKARELIIDARKILYQISASAKQYESAYRYLFSYLSLRDSIINEKTSKNIARLEADYIINKKQSEIQLLENKNRNRSIMSVASLIIGVMAVFVALLFYTKQQQIQKTNNKLEKAYNDLETTQKKLIHHEKLASLGQLTAGIAHEIKNPLNFVNNFSQISIDLLRELEGTKSDEDRKFLIEDLELNLEKISKHGERANSIITRMLDHSRSGEREQAKTDINKLITEYYSLAYQAARIHHPGFFCNAVMNLDPEIPEIIVVTQEISRVLLNLFNNSLYVLHSIQHEKSQFTPEITVKTQKVDEKIIIEIRDNGPGIPASILDKIFQPFFTTKPAGEGTGLGLSLSYDIINAHGGTITASNPAGGGALFTISLPLKS